MNFQCKLCVDKYFKSNKDVIQHLKTVHKVKDGQDQIECTVRNSKCGKYFQTFKGLARHLPKCSSELETENVSKSNANEPSNVPESETPGCTEQISFVFNESIMEKDQSSMISKSPPSDHGNSFVYDDITTNPYPECQHVNSFVMDSTDSLTPHQITSSFLTGLLTLNMNEKTMNDVLRLTQSLVENTHKFCEKSIQSNGTNTLEALDCSIGLISNGLQKLNSSFKRKNFLERQQSFVKPKQIGIGTHWVNERDKDSHMQVPAHKQSLFSFIPPCEIIKKLFEKPHFREMYFTYNQTTKHACEPNVYRDFCCGNVYKEMIDFFEQNPNAIQLQFFFDGFELCSDLKSKTQLHSQVAVYMVVRNMPPRFAYNMNNIFLVCLVNENDLKKAETDYTNILEQIVKDVRILESAGIDLGNGVNLKGKMVQRSTFCHCILNEEFNRLCRSVL